MKKGTTSVEAMIGLALLALVILAAIFSVKTLLSKGKDTAFSVGEGKLPGDSPLPPSHESVPLDIAKDFDDFAAIINRYKNENRCLVPLAKIPDMKNDYFIELYPNEALLKKKEGSEIRTYKVEMIEKFDPCVISFLGAQNFYDNWLDGTINALDPAKPEYYEFSDATKDIKLESQTKIITPKEPNVGSPWNYEISNKEGQRYLYKADANHFCFISVKNDDWDDCILRAGKSSPQGLHEQCIASLPFFVPICGGVSVPINEFKSKCDNICNKKNKQCILGIDDGGTYKACNSEFGFENNPRDDYCICDSDSKKVFPLLLSSNLKSTCNNICSSVISDTKKCITGIDDGGTYKVCDAEFRFEKDKYAGDDYCICDSDSKKVVPLFNPQSSSDLKSTCNNICSSVISDTKKCITGIDDSDKYRACNIEFGFEKNDVDDYCICDSDSEKVIPVS